MRAALSLSSRLALWAIRRYQRHLSPLKGFSCAYRVARGGDSCSAHGYRAIERYGLLTGLALLDRRLLRCGEVHRKLRSVPNPVLHYQRGDCDCGSCDIGDLKGLGGCACDLAGDCGSSRKRRERCCASVQGWRGKRWRERPARR